MKRNHLEEMFLYFFFSFLTAVIIRVVEMCVECFGILTSFDSPHVLLRRGGQWRYSQTGTLV